MGEVGVGAPGLSHELNFGGGLDTRLVKRILAGLDTEAERGQVGYVRRDRVCLHENRRRNSSRYGP